MILVSRILASSVTRAEYSFQQFHRMTTDFSASTKQ